MKTMYEVCGRNDDILCRLGAEKIAKHGMRSDDPEEPNADSSTCDDKRCCKKPYQDWARDA